MRIRFSLIIFIAGIALCGCGKPQNNNASETKAASGIFSLSQGKKPSEVDIMGIKMVHIPGGSFVKYEESLRYDIENPYHRISIDSLLVGKFEVTQAQWDAIMQANPSRNKNPNNPVNGVTWNESQEFIQRLNKKTKHRFRLLTQAEWEYAARGGAVGDFHWGITKNVKRANFGMQKNTSVAVGSYSPNLFGLHDMVGNVKEWVQDNEREKVILPENGSAFENGSDRRVVCGDSYNSADGLRDCDSRNIDHSINGKPDSRVGFRIAIGHEDAIQISAPIETNRTINQIIDIVNRNQGDFASLPTEDLLALSNYVWSNGWVLLAGSVDGEIFGRLPILINAHDSISMERYRNNVKHLFSHLNEKTFSRLNLLREKRGGDLVDIMGEEFTNNPIDFGFGSDIKKKVYTLLENNRYAKYERESAFEAMGKVYKAGGNAFKKYAMAAFGGGKVDYLIVNDMAALIILKDINSATHFSVESLNSVIARYIRQRLRDASRICDSVKINPCGVANDSDETINIHLTAAVKSMVDNYGIPN